MASAMHSDCLAVRWMDAESSGYSDLLPIELLQTRGSHTQLVHDVEGPNGGRYFAKCRLSVSDRVADLDYEAFPDENNRQGMYLGILRLHFADHDHTAITRAEWKPFGQRAFKPAKVVVSEHNPPAIKPYKPALIPSLKATRLVRERPGQRRFRTHLKSVFGGRCSITGCGVGDALEGAHIDRYQGPDSDHPQNGILLRRDLHALFDADQMGIEPERLVVHFSESAQSWQEYGTLHRRARLRLPQNKHYQPSPQALARRWQSFCAANENV